MPTKSPKLTPSKVPALKRCSICKVSLALAMFTPKRGSYGGVTSACKSCRADRERENYERLGRAQDAALAAAANEIAARAARLASDTEALKPEDFDVTVANDGRRDPKASKEKRQEFSKAMGEHAASLRRAAIGASEGKGSVADLMDPEAGGYIAKVAEQERRFQNRRLARSVSLAAAGEALTLHAFKQAAAEYLRDKITPTGYARKAPDRAMKRSAVLLLSDLHIGAELSALDNPMPYRAIEEARRLEFVVRQLLDFKPQYRNNTEAVVLLNGDVIEGLLMHDFRDGAPLVEQQCAFLKYMQSALGLIAQQFPSVRVICQPGNHGRNKLRHPGRATSSKWDGVEWGLYWSLKEMCSGLRNTTWDLGFRAVSIVDLHGSKLGLTHGDTEVKFVHPDKSDQNARIMDRVNSTHIYGVEFAAWAIGHYHSPRYLPRNPSLVCNGALIPPNGYARGEGYISDPCGQFLWEACEGFPVGDLRFIGVGRAQDIDEALGTLIKPFRFGSGDL